MPVEKLVPRVDTTFFDYSPIPTKRISQEDALDPQAVKINLEPNEIAKIDLEGVPWSVVSVKSPYNKENPHVMLIELSERYVPDPIELSGEEGSALMNLSANIVGFQKLKVQEDIAIKGITNIASINVGYNWSPYSYGAEEEKGGFQSVTSKLHVQIWPFEKGQIVPYSSLDERMQRVLRGSPYSRLAGKVIGTYLRRTQSPLLKLETLSLDNTGLEVDLGDNLENVLKNEKFFSNFLQPLASFLNNFAGDIASTFSDVDLEKTRDEIKRSFEGSRDGILPSLREDPHLLPFHEREQKIQGLLAKGYPKDFVEALRRINPALRERGLDENERDQKEPDKQSWFRKGFGYAATLSEEINEKTGETERVFLKIMPGIFIGDKGGVVEALGIALNRVKETIPDEQNPDFIRKLRLTQELGDYLTSKAPVSSKI